MIGYPSGIRNSIHIVQAAHEAFTHFDSPPIRIGYSLVTIPRKPSLRFDLIEEKRLYAVIIAMVVSVNFNLTQP